MRSKGYTNTAGKAERRVVVERIGRGEEIGASTACTAHETGRRNCEAGSIRKNANRILPANPGLDRQFE
jgi:hypothetical protein